MRRLNLLTSMIVAAMLMGFAAEGASAADAKPEIAPELAELVKGNNQFALELYAKLSAEEKGNIFFSPFSISSALAMTYAGARGNTEAEMARVLHFTLAQKKLHAAMSGLVDDLLALGKEAKPPYEISIANALWGQKGEPFLPAFLDLTRQRYKAGFQALDFVADPEKARGTINAWIEEQTHRKIRDLLRKGDTDPLTSLVLTNAIYFHGNWDRQFKNVMTHDARFTLEDKTVVRVPMMKQTGQFRHNVWASMSALEMPYVSGRLSMVILLPAEAGGLPDVEKGLNEGFLDHWLKAIHSKEVTVSLPRFKTTQRFELNQTLQAMGMKDAFAQADFSAMNGRKDLSISKVVHKAFVDVNEEGTEAAAATGVIMARGADTATAFFNADHPFLFLIRDNRTGSILFLGRILDPRDAGQP